MDLKKAPPIVCKVDIQNSMRRSPAAALCSGRDGPENMGVENMLKSSWLAFLLLSSFLPALAWAQTESAGAPGCGAPDSKFEVKTEKQPQSAQPDAAKALVYFIENDSDFGSNPKPTTRLGVDGEWVGATHGNSYFHFLVDPGVHHLCASWQTTVILGQGHKTAAAHFTAEAGGVYYFEAKNSWWLDHGSASISLHPLDSDEGQLLTNQAALSTFQLKK
jgi:hypothetical protein